MCNELSFHHSGDFQDLTIIYIYLFYMCDNETLILQEKGKKPEHTDGINQR